MLIQLASVLSQDGRTEHQIVPVEMTEFSCQVGSFPVSQKSDIDLTITHKGKRVLLIEGQGEVVLTVPCGRCLTPVEVVFPIRIEREADMKLTEAEQLEALDECDYIQDTVLDVEKLLYNEILVSWPIRVLCKEDCKGICSRCGANLNFGTCDCDTAELDPRMAVISDIFSKFKEV